MAEKKERIKCLATLIIKCVNCGEELLGDVYRVDKGSFGDRPFDHVFEEFKFDKHIGYFCSDCIRSDYLKGRIKKGNGSNSKTWENGR